MPTSYEKEMERLRKLFAELETDEDSDFDNENNRPEDISEESFSNHESFSSYDTVSKEDGDYGNEELPLAYETKAEIGLKIQNKKRKAHLRMTKTIPYFLDPLFLYFHPKPLFLKAVDEKTSIIQIRRFIHLKKFFL
ncbi:hypothetical protein AVEN_174913-1 [Araneus ventricosus]|uniref:Uncharacterized protein n=1 Tax=Araneus ventricosus TaxID=182803 RepID=A0A4Y2U3R3_ARAVE|nr:hypothetical protein AVEN_245169-1 [Araneus ventricosus]GBO07264.1 hypothetical protein AVEN_174913-1 [Araneus ventricosus]